MYRISILHYFSAAGMSTEAAEIKKLRQELVAKVDKLCADGPNPAGQFPRQFIPINEASSSGQQRQPFRVLHWNILAQALTGADGGSHFDRVDPIVTNWERRRWYLLRELLRYEPDILCLNEVDVYQFLSEQLVPLGYRGFFRPKPRSPCLIFPGNFGPDGTAILYNSHRFECLHSDSDFLIESSHDGAASSSGSGAQVFVLLRLRSLAPQDNSRELWIAATHLKAKVAFANLRLLQTEALIAALAKRVPAEAPLLLCGDFNGESFEPYYSLLSQSSLNLTSAYKQPAEPPFTTYKYVSGAAEPQARAIDYIWYRRLLPTALLEIPPRDSVEPTGLPCAAFPSDHFCLSADFLLAD